MVVVDTRPHFDRDRDRRSLDTTDGRCDNLAEQASLIGQCSSATSSSHLRHRAPKIHVDVVSQVVVGNHASSFVRPLRIRRVQLHAAWCFFGSELRHVQSFLVPLDECSRGHHLADIEPRRRPRFFYLEFTTQQPKSHICYPRHRCKNDGGR